MARNIPVLRVRRTLAVRAVPAFLVPSKEVRDPQTPTTSRLDRAALQKLAASAGGQYFELERDGDRRIANAVIDTGKRIAPSIGLREDAEELYWYFLLLAAGLILLGCLFVRSAGLGFISPGRAVLVWAAASSTVIPSRLPEPPFGPKSPPAVRHRLPYDLTFGVPLIYDPY